MKIIDGGGTSHTLGSLFYDFSGASYHYNADYAVGFRIAEIVSPASVTITKSFVPKAISPGGTSVLIFRLSNPTPETITGVNFSDIFPAGLEVHGTPAVSYLGCGTGAFSPAPSGGVTSLYFADGTIVPKGVCIISINVTAPEGTYSNTTGNLFINMTDDTGNSGSDTLIASDAPACIPGQSLASWAFPTGSNANTPAPSTKAVDVSSATASTTVTAPTIDTGSGNPAPSWAGRDFPKNATITGDSLPYFQFAIDTSKYSSVQISLDYRRDSSWGGGGADTPTVYVWSSTTGAAGSYSQIFSSTTFDTTFRSSGTLDAAATGSSLTYFRINAKGATNANAFMQIDNVNIIGCAEPVPAPAITKSFSPDPILKGASSMLTFTISNTATGSAPLTGIAFTDVLPAGLSIADASLSECGGTLTTTDSTRTIELTGGSLAAGGSCSFNVSVTGTLEGQFENVSGFISSDESGISTNYAIDTLTVIAPPVISKSFSPTSIYVNDVSTLTFSISNTNQSVTLTGISFEDILPSGVTVADDSSSRCNGTLTTTAATGTIELNGGWLSANTTCTFSVTVTGVTVGQKENTTDAVTSNEGGDGNTAAATLAVSDPQPLIGLNKQISTDGTNWFKSVGIVPVQNVYYRFTVYNDGEVTLEDIAVTDPDVNMAGCTPSLPTSLLVGESAECVVGPLSITSTPDPNPYINIATVTTSTYTISEPETSSASYGTTSLTIVKSADKSSFTAVGELLTYNYLVTNNGGYPLPGPVAVADDKSTDETCPAVGTVGDNDNYLDPGESIICTATYNISASDMLAGFVTNTASATVNGVSSNEDSITVYSPGADISVTKTADNMSPGSGDTVVYTLTVTNNGPSNATGVQLTDILPSGVTYVSDTSGGDYVPGTGVWNIGPLNVGSSATIDITVTVNQTGKVINIASITASDLPDPDRSNNSSGLILNTGKELADLGVAKEVDNPTPSAGDNVTFTVTVTNNGPDNATGVLLIDILPAGLSYIGDDASGAYDSVTGIWTLGSLNVGDSATLNITAQVPDDTVEIINTAGITESDQKDPDITNNQSSALINQTHDTIADLAVQKIVNLDMANVGDNLVFTILVRNNGPDDSENVVISDLLPSGMNYVSSSPTQGSYDEIAGQWSIGTISAYGYAILDIVAELDDPDPQTNTASVESNDAFDPDTTNDSDDASISTVAADLSISKSDNPDPVVAGQTLTYTITVINAGPSDAANLAVTDTLPAGVAFVSASGTDWSCGHSGGVVTCTRASLAVGSAPDITITVTVDAGTSGPLSNNVSVTSDTHDPDTEDNSASESTAVSTSADLSITKTDSVDPVVAGNNLTYTITVSNAGPSDAANVVVTDTLPAGVTFVSSTGCTESAAGGVPTCSLGTVSAGGNKQYTVTVTVNAGTTGTITNSVSAASDTSDPDDTNNSTSEDTAVNEPTIFDPPFGLKTVNDSGYPELIWGMVWINNSNATAMLVRIVDPIPANTTYVNGSVSCIANGTSSTTQCIYDNVNNRIVWEGTISPDPGATDESEASNEVVITYRTSVGVNVMSASNQGHAYWDEEGDGSVDDDIDAAQTPASTDDPSTQVSGDPTVWTRNSLLPVHAMNNIGILLFMMLAGIISVIYLRQRRRSPRT